MSVALVSILGPDQVGLVASIAGELFDSGVSLRDTTFAALGAGAEFTAVCDLPEEVSPEAVEEGLRRLPELEGAQVRVVPYAFDPNPTALARVTHRITIGGGDQLGLVARLAEIFAKSEANIVRLEARKLSDEEGGLYVTRFAVAIDPDRRDICLAAVTSTAGTLSLTCQIEASES
jgi:glycine cleavage system transcriptional repressor